MARSSSKNSSRRDNILVLDAGTTGVKALVFDPNLDILGRAYRPLRKTTGAGGRVEQDPKQILAACKAVIKSAVKASGIPARRIAGLGITNQRETAVIWSRRTGEPLYPAIVWQDTRTAAWCAKLRKKYEPVIRRKTGLRLDPYFSAPKISWMLSRPAIKKAAGRGDALFGTVDSWLLWNLSEGRPHATDHTNASRTLLFNIKTLAWDSDLLRLFGVPADVLPAIFPSRHRFGVLDRRVAGYPIPVLGICGDQQASMFAAGIRRGTTKVTYGTGAFASQALGPKFELHPGLFTTLVPSGSKTPLYMVEGKVDDCAARITPVIGNERLMRKEVTRLAREVAAYLKRLPIPPKRIVVDGGVTRYDKLPEIQAKAAGIPARRQKIYDGTALGAAMLVKQAMKK